jgi:hypothetical protein
MKHSDTGRCSKRQCWEKVSVSTFTSTFGIVFMTGTLYKTESTMSDGIYNRQKLFHQAYNHTSLIVVIIPVNVAASEEGGNLKSE